MAYLDITLVDLNETSDMKYLNNTQQNYVLSSFDGISKNESSPKSVVNSNDYEYTNNTTNDMDRCPELHIFDIRLIECIVCICIAIFGLFLCLFGYRMLRSGVFLVSTFFISILMCFGCYEIFPEPSLILIAGLTLLVASIIGIISMYFISHIGIRLTSCSAAFILATFFLVSIRIFLDFPSTNFIHNSTEDFETFTDTDKVDFNYFDTQLVNPLSEKPQNTHIDWNHIISILITILTILFLAFIFLFITYIRSKFILIFSFSLFGSTMLILCAEHLLESSPFLTQLSIKCLTAKLGHVEINKDFAFASLEKENNSIQAIIYDKNDINYGNDDSKQDSSDNQRDDNDYTYITSNTNNMTTESSRTEQSMQKIQTDIINNENIIPNTSSTRIHHNTNLKFSKLQSKNDLITKSNSYHSTLVLKCWVTWILYISLPFLVVFSVAFQYCCSAKDFFHEFNQLTFCSNESAPELIPTIISSRESNNQSKGRLKTHHPVPNDTTIPANLLEPAERFRHLYRIRRTNGDVISRTQMEAIEVRKSNPSSMLLSVRSTSDMLTTSDDDASLIFTPTAEQG